MDYSLPGSSFFGISQARILEWVAFPTPGDLPDPEIELASLASPALAGGFFPMNHLECPIKEAIVQLLSCVQLFVTPWTVAYQDPPSMEFSRPEYWSGLPFPSPGDLPDSGIELRSPALQADALLSEPPGKLID